MSENKNKRTIFVIISIPDIKESNKTIELNSFTYKRALTAIISYLSELRLKEIKEVLNKIKITIKRSEIKINKLNNMKVFINTEIHYCKDPFFSDSKKDNIYFNRFITDVFKNLLDSN